MTKNTTRAAIRLLAATALLGAATAAQAALVTTMDYTITGTDFAGTFTMAYSGGEYSLTAFSATYLGYQFDLTNTGLRQSKSQVIIGGIVGGVSGIGGGTNDFATGYFTPSTTAQIYNGASVTTNTAFVNNAFTVTPVAAAGAVPEPASWAMMIAGFGAVGGAMRRRTSVSKVAFA